MLCAFPLGRDCPRSLALWCALLIAACGPDLNNTGGAGSAAPLPGAGSTAGSSAGGSSGSMAAANSAGKSGSGGAPSVATAGAGGTSSGTAGSSSAGAGAVAGAGGTTEPQPAGNADWTLMGYDLGSTFYNRAETKLTKANAATLDIAWQKDLGGPVYSAALQIGDKIYVAAPSSVRAFTAATGEELWSTMVSSTSSLSYADGTLYLNDGGASIVAINAADGNKLWTKASNPSSQSRWIVIGAAGRQPARRRRLERRRSS